MSASLVGSEMCIRDRCLCLCLHARARVRVRVRACVVAVVLLPGTCFVQTFPESVQNIVEEPPSLSAKPLRDVRP
eukprot:8785015-Alexandrium_andersonii.AAC.1